MSDFFPKRDAELLEWLKNFSSTLSAKAASWGVPALAAEGLAASLAAYETVFAAATGEAGTKALVTEKNEKRDALKAELRNIKNKHIDYNDSVSDGDRERLGLHVWDKNPSPKGRPVSRPALEVVPTNNRQHSVTAANITNGKKNRPDDAHGVRFVWEIRDDAPENAEDLRHSEFRVKTHEVFDYNEGDRGKKVFYAACYENAKGEAGPWSDIVWAVIP